MNITEEDRFGIAATVLPDVVVVGEAWGPRLVSSHSLGSQADASGCGPALRQHLGLLDDGARRLLLLVRRVAMPVEDPVHHHA